MHTTWRLPCLHSFACTYAHTHTHIHIRVLVLHFYPFFCYFAQLSHRWEEKEFLNTLNVSLNTLTFQPAFPSTPNSSSNSGGVSESGEERKEGARNEGKRRKKNRRGGGKARGREDGWIEREGSSGGSSISLPSPLSPPRPIQALPHLIFRTVIEEELSSVIDWKGARVFLQERARATTTDMPFVCPNSDSEFDVHWWDVVMTILVNRISHHFREGFIDYAVGAEVVRKVFVFGLTFENYGEEFRKLRLILVEKDTLEDIVSNPSKYSNVVIEKKTFLPRLACIRIMAELYANEQQAMREVENRVGREGKRERERRNLSEGGGRSGGVVVELDKATVEMVKEDKEVQQQRMKGKLREVEIWRRSTSADGRS